jgi:hypothetical protein
LKFLKFLPEAVMQRKIKRMLTLLHAAAIWAGSQAATANAQHEGRWEVPPGGYIDPEGVLTPAQRADAVALLDRILEIVRRTPALVRPTGANVAVSRTVEHYVPSGPRPLEHVVRSDLWIGFFPVGPDGKQDTHAGAVITVSVNPLHAWPGWRSIARDSAGALFRAEQAHATTASHATWIGRATTASAWKREVLIVPPGLQVHAPVTQERWLHHQIREAARTVAEVGTPGSPYQRWLDEAPQRRAAIQTAVEALNRTDPVAARQLQKEFEETEHRVAAELRELEGPHAAMVERAAAHLDSLRRRLEALTPAERIAPAWVNNVQELVAPGTPHAQPIVALNAAAFPRGAGTEPRAIVVSLNAFRPVMIGLMEAAYRELDWAALTALVVR